jgi:histidinol-phosphate phosphatase family protein
VVWLNQFPDENSGFGMAVKNLDRCVFFDRDGVVNVSPGKGYVLSWDQFGFTPGIEKVLRRVREKGWRTVLVTSQRGVGKGLMSQAELELIHGKMQDHLSRGKASFDAIYAYTETPDCPHSAKPDPEMLLTAAKDLGIDLGQSWIIGDSDRDISMGKAAGLKGGIRFLSEKAPGVTADFTVSDTAALEELLEGIL